MCTCWFQSTCNAGDHLQCRDTGLIPGWGRSLGEGTGTPLQYSCLGNLVERGACSATVHGVARVGHNLMTKPPSPHVNLKFLNYPLPSSPFWVQSPDRACGSLMGKLKGKTCPPAPRRGREEGGWGPSTGDFPQEWVQHPSGRTWLFSLCRWENRASSLWPLFSCWASPRLLWKLNVTYPYRRSSKPQAPLSLIHSGTWRSRSKPGPDGGRAVVRRIWKLISLPPTGLTEQAPSDTATLNPFRLLPPARSRILASISS